MTTDIDEAIDSTSPAVQLDFLCAVGEIGLPHPEIGNGCGGLS